MTDDNSANPYHPGRAKAAPLSSGRDAPADDDGLPASPAETGFPYLATQGIQPGSPSAPSSPEPTRARLRNRRPVRRGRSPWLAVLIGVASGLFVLAVLGAYVIWGPTGNPVAGPTTPSAPDATAAGAVRGYLQALAAGDADAALGFAATPPADASLLTDEVLTSALAGRPLAEIEVGESPDDPPRQLVSAHYRLGAEVVSSTFEVERKQDVWRLAEVAATLDLTALRWGEVPLTINGAPVVSTTPSLFPGAYTLGTSAARYMVENPDFVVQTTTGQPGLGATLTLSEEGRSEIAAAATAHLKACVKQRELDPTDCGFALTNPKGTKLKKSTMRWAVHSGAEQLDDLDLVLDHPGSATAKVDIVVRGEVRGTDGSRWKASVRLTRMRADLTGEKVTIQFA